MTSQDMTELAIVTFDFHSGVAGELSLKVMDVVHVIRRIDNNWTLGQTKDGRQGIYPNNFAHTVAVPPLQPGQKLFIATANFLGGQKGDLNFSKGQVIKGLQAIDSYWWQGTIGSSNHGIFPLTHVKEVYVQPETKLRIREVPPRPLLSSTESGNMGGTYEVYINGALSYRGQVDNQGRIDGQGHINGRGHIDSQSHINGQGHIDGRQVVGEHSHDRHIYHGGINSGTANNGPVPTSKAEEPRTPNYAPSSSSIPSTAAQTASSSCLFTAKAVVDAVAQIDGELGFSTGDIVMVTEVIDSDWLRGSCHGKEGIFFRSLVDDGGQGAQYIKAPQADEIVISTLDESWKSKNHDDVDHHTSYPMISCDTGLNVSPGSDNPQINCSVNRPVNQPVNHPVCNPQPDISSESSAFVDAAESTINELTARDVKHIISKDPRLIKSHSLYKSVSERSLPPPPPNIEHNLPPPPPNIEHNTNPNEEGQTMTSSDIQTQDTTLDGTKQGLLHGDTGRVDTPGDSMVTGTSPAIDSGQSQTSTADVHQLPVSPAQTLQGTVPLISTDQRLNLGNDAVEDTRTSSTAVEDIPPPDGAAIAHAAHTVNTGPTAPGAMEIQVADSNPVETEVNGNSYAVTHGQDAGTSAEEGSGCSPSAAASSSVSPTMISQGNRLVRLPSSSSLQSHTSSNRSSPPPLDENQLEALRSQAEELEQDIERYRDDLEQAHEREADDETLSFYIENINGMMMELHGLKKTLQRHTPASSLLPRSLTLEEEENLKNSELDTSLQALQSDEYDTNKIKAKRETRSRVILEILDTEESFHDDMALCYQIFRGGDAPPPPESFNLDLIFGNLTEVIDISDRLARQLRSIIADDGVAFDDKIIGRPFVELAPAMKTVYAPYCRNHDEAAAALDNCYAAEGELGDQIKAYVDAGVFRMKAVTNVFTLASVLIKPVQRVMRYALLLGELEKVTEMTHPDKTAVLHALDAMRQLADDINEYKRRKDLVYRYRGDQQQDSSLRDKVAKLNFHSIRKKSKRLSVRMTSAFSSSSSSTTSVLTASGSDVFAKLEEEFRDLFKTARHLSKNVVAFMEQMDRCKACEEAVATRFCDLYGTLPPSMSYASDTSRGLRTTKGLFKQSLERRVLEPLQRITNLFDGPNNVIQKRRDKLLDFEGAHQKVERTKDIDRVKVARDELGIARKNFEALDVQLKQELPEFSSMVCDLLMVVVQQFIGLYDQFIEEYLSHMMPHWSRQPGSPLTPPYVGAASAQPRFYQ